MPEKRNLKFLMVKAHPHDFTHAAATMGIHISQGDSVTLVVVTGGVAAHNEKLMDELRKPLEQQDPAIINQSADDYAAEKERELRAAAAIFGINDVRVLGYPMPFRVERYPAAVTQIKKIILEVRPDVIVSQSPFAQGPHGLCSGAFDDHQEAAFATYEAESYAGVPEPGSRVAPHRVAATYYPGVYFQRDEYDFVVDITAWYDRRVKAEEMFKTQGHTPEYARRVVELITGNIGWYSGLTYGEAFVRSRADVVDKIQVPEFFLKRAHEPVVDQIKRYAGKKEKG